MRPGSTRRCYLLVRREAARDADGTGDELGDQLAVQRRHQLAGAHGGGLREPHEVVARDVGAPEELDLARATAPASPRDRARGRARRSRASSRARRRRADRRRAAPPRRTGRRRTSRPPRPLRRPLTKPSRSSSSSASSSTPVSRATSPRRSGRSLGAKSASSSSPRRASSSMRGTFLRAAVARLEQRADGVQRQVAALQVLDQPDPLHRRRVVVGHGLPGLARPRQEPFVEVVLDGGARHAALAHELADTEVTPRVCASLWPPARILADAPKVLMTSRR